jgi:large subunit ribosomal protein L23
MRINQILIKPILTEKSTNLVKIKQYTFLVANNASKSQIKQALEDLFKVKVDKIRIILRKGKIKRVGRKGFLKKDQDRKLAVVSLKEGKIDLFPQA